MQTQENITTPNQSFNGGALQSAVPHAIRVANEASTKAAVKPSEPKLNLRRKIYDVLKGYEAQALVSEIQEHMKPFGYPAGTVSATLSTMYKQKILLRSQKSPYAYWVNPEATVPNDAPMRTSTPRKPVVKAKIPLPVQAKPPVKGPQPAPLNLLNLPQGDALSVLGDMLDRTISNDYVSLERDIDTVSKYLSDQSKTFQSNEKDVAKECDQLRAYAESVGAHLESLRAQTRNLRLMAQLIRKSSF